MVCFTCKGDVKKSTTTYMTEVNSCYIIIKNVPCTKCSQCGEEFLVSSVAEKIDSILDNIEKIASKIFILDYVKAA